MSYSTPWYFSNPHIQTLLNGTLRRHKNLKLRKEILDTPDGDFLDLRWTKDTQQGPLVLILHGLCGSVKSSYIRGIMACLREETIGAVLMHHRGCGEDPNRLNHRLYHSGDTEDLTFVADTLKKRFPRRNLYVLGYSLGANLLLKWLEEKRKNLPVRAACAVSVPFDLSCSSAYLQRGFGKIYGNYYLRKLKKAMRRKYLPETAPFDWAALSGVKTLEAFDDLVTAPLYGFASAQDYYKKCSSKQFLKYITKPTLILQAKDDPLLQENALPKKEHLSSKIIYEEYAKGGHVGFIYGNPWKMKFYLEERIISFIKSRENSR